VTGAREFTHIGDGESLYSLPRIAPWHLLLSRKLYELIMEDPSMIYPKEIREEGEKHKRQKIYGVDKDMPLFLDTFGEITHNCRFVWDDMIKIGTVPNVEFEKWAHHFFSSSLNYGEWSLHEQHGPHLESIKRIYETEFPDVLKALQGIE